MATTTPNFGWAVPTSTDLVKDGAVAIETLGDSIDASLVDLKGGTTGQVLAKASGTDMDFSWTTPSAGGGGKVLQVVHGSYATETASSTTTYADTGLTATITPTSATSKILVIVSQQGVMKYIGSSGQAVQIRLVRGATTILKMSDSSGYTANSGTNNIGSVSASYLDSPATTSATTYKTQFAAYVASAAAYVQHYLADTTSPVSTITLMEIGA